MSVAQVSEAHQKLHLLRETFHASRPKYSLTVTSMGGLEGHLVIWNLPDQPDPNLGSCAKGGTRISPTLTLAELERLAKTMALKNAAANLPLGGAKSGIRSQADDPLLERHYREFAQMLRPLLIEHGGPFGGFGFDVGARSEHALWVIDELNSSRCFTGKPSTLGGTDYDREGIAGLGVAIAARTALAFDKAHQQPIRFALQGIGAMGVGVLRYCEEFDGALYAVSDPRLGGSYFLRAPASLELKTALLTGELEEARLLLQSYATGPFDSETILEADVDAFFPCATQDVITAESVFRIKARYIFEGANNPSSAEAKALFASAGRLLIPDFLANAGGIIAAYVEMLAGAGTVPPENMSLVQYAKQMVRERIGHNVHTVLYCAKELRLDPAGAGELLALSRLHPEHQASALARFYTSGNS